MKYCFLIILVYNCYAQTKTPKMQVSQRAKQLGDINNTRWERKIAKECINYISFKNGKYEQFNCELDYPFSGEYKVKMDTLYLTEIDLKSSLPSEKKYVVKSKSKWIMTNGKLMIVTKDELKNGKWEKSRFKPSIGVSYSKKI